MKKTFRVASAVCCMVLSFPMTGWAATNDVRGEKTEVFPITVKAEKTNAFAEEERVQIKEMTIKETSKDSFSKNQQFYFSVENGDLPAELKDLYVFEQGNKMKISEETVKAEYEVKGEKLLLTIKDSDPDQLETITLKDLTVKKNREGVILKTYSLGAATDLNTEEKIVVSDFMKVEEYKAPVEKEKLDIKIKLNEKRLFVNGIEKGLRVPAYISDAGYTMLPIREVTDVFPGTNVFWNNERKEAVILFGYEYVSIVSEADVMHIDGKEYPLKNAAEVRDGRMFVSLRDMCRICNIPSEDISWDNATRTVHIDTEI